MDSAGIQQTFFRHIKGLLPPHISLVDAIADLLNISNDSAYRRIRGEKPISIEEMKTLATHFKISLDQFLHLQNDNFIFSGKLINNSDHTFEKWVESILQQLQFIATFGKKHIYYLAKDMPLMQQFLMPELAAFKFFFWQKSILHYDELKGTKFSLKNIPDTHMDYSKRIINVYNKIDSTDIWNVESINSTIRQIEFYRDANAFESKEDIDQLYLAVLKIIDHLEYQAEKGSKYSIGGEPGPDAARYNLYNNELILGDNTLLFEVDNMYITILNHSVINFISTRDEVFNTYMYHMLTTLIKKSTALSVSSEKERTRFFNRVREKIKAASRI